MRAIFERGIGCDRAVVIEQDRLVEAHLEMPGIRAGDVWEARLLEVDGLRAVVEVGGPCALDPLPAGSSEGGLVLVEVVREPIPRPDGVRAAKVRPRTPQDQRRPGRNPGQAYSPREGATSSPIAFGTMDEAGLRSPGAALRGRLAARGLAIVDQNPHAPDLLEAAGWSEALEEARTGEVAFPGGRLLIERTAAFEVIDVDGHLPPPELAVAAAHAVAAAVRRFDLAGSIVVDFPTAGDPVARRALGDVLDAALPKPFERTAMNGFGLVQIVRPKLRPSLMDRMQANPAEAAALALLRQAERTSGPGATTITAPRAMHAWLSARSDLLAELERRTGRAAALVLDASIPLEGGHAQAG